MTTKIKRDEARCEICGGQIHQWHSAPGRWYHDTINVDDEPFDAFEMWGRVKRDEWHEGKSRSD